MGTPELSAVPTSDNQIQTMKVFVLLCVVAAAMAEVDPYLVYSGYGGLHHGYAGYGAIRPAVYGGVYGYGGYPYASTFHYGKREAEADAKPYYYSGLHYPTVYGGAYTYGYPYAGV